MWCDCRRSYWTALSRRHTLRCSSLYLTSSGCCYDIMLTVMKSLLALLLLAALPLTRVAQSLMSCLRSNCSQVGSVTHVTSCPSIFSRRTSSHYVYPSQRRTLRLACVSSAPPNYCLVPTVSDATEIDSLLTEAVSSVVEIYSAVWRWEVERYTDRPAR